MTNYEQMAEKMYSAYCQQAGGLTFDGKPLPSFQELGLERQTCWKAAAEAAHEQYAQPQADALDAIAAAVAAEREACAKLCETFADRVFDIGFTPVEKEHPFSTIAGANQCAVDIRARAAIAAAKENK